MLRKYCLLHVCALPVSLHSSTQSTLSYLNCMCLILCISIVVDWIKQYSYSVIFDTRVLNLYIVVFCPSDGVKLSLLVKNLAVSPHC